VDFSTVVVTFYGFFLLGGGRSGIEER